MGEVLPKNRVEHIYDQNDDETGKAIAAGDKTYIGQACLRGHNVRYTNSNACVQCKTDYDSSRIHKWAELNNDPMNFNHPVFIVGNPARFPKKLETNNE